VPVTRLLLAQFRQYVCQYLFGLVALLMPPPLSAPALCPLSSCPTTLPWSLLTHTHTIHAHNMQPTTMCCRERPVQTCTRCLQPLA
jgi:hypothetical protein